MELSIGPRRSGRTTRLIIMMIENPELCLITHSIAEAERLKTMYPGLSRRIVPWAARTTLQGRGYTRLLIDNLDLIVGGVAGPSSIEKVTWGMG